MRWKKVLDAAVSAGMIAGVVAAIAAVLYGIAWIDDNGLDTGGGFKSMEQSNHKWSLELMRDWTARLPADFPATSHGELTTPEELEAKKAQATDHRKKELQFPGAIKIAEEIRLKDLPCWYAEERDWIFVWTVKKEMLYLSVTAGNNMNPHIAWLRKEDGAWEEQGTYGGWGEFEAARKFGSMLTFK